LKSIVTRLGLLREDGKPPMVKSPPLPNPTAILEKRAQTLESLLKEEQARCQKQAEELALLRSQLRPIDELQADLVVEREAGRQLVQWLQEAEQRVADLQSRRLTLVGEPPRKTSYFPQVVRNASPIHAPLQRAASEPLRKLSPNLLGADRFQQPHHCVDLQFLHLKFVKFGYLSK
jgi:hypothetical protein